ncbi:MAG: arylsulfatase [Opitutaceae bacterium]|nr:arylsulfatase [Opitutaceae bacterium]
MRPLTSSPRHLGRQFAGLLAAIAGLFATAVAGAAASKPNIVYIIADDLGYGDVGCYGQKLIRTPRIDRMAKEGMRFTQHYAGAPLCAPSRSVLMTGLHTGHTRVRSNAKKALEPDDHTIAEVLKGAGYATAGVGKWGLGDADTTGAPWKKGFDLFFGYLDQTHAHNHYPEFLWRNEQRVEISENKGGQMRVYSPDLMAKEALAFIRANRDRPFFLYGAFTPPHAEVAAPPDSVAEYHGKWPEPNKFKGSATYRAQDEPRAVRAAMITRLDRYVGSILDLLDELNLAQNTLVIFTSDNGPITAGGQDPEFFDSNGPLRDLKFTLYEGGIRVPFIARWPGRIAAGTTENLVSDFADMFPTFAELTGTKPPGGLDGVSIAPTLLGQRGKQARRDHFYWEYAPQQAVRQGDWKAYRGEPNGPIELYHLAEDIGETKNVAARHPDIVARLEKLLTTSHVDSPDFPLKKKQKQAK